MPLFLSFNIINADKPTTKKEKLADNNEGSKSKNKFEANKEELANDNGRNPDNKSSADIISLVGEKNINQDSNAGIEE